MNVKRVGYFAGHRAGITSLAAGWGSKNNLLISGSEDKTSRLWDMRTKKAVHGIVGFEQEITAVEFVGDDSFAVACGNTIYVYDQRYIGIVHQAQKSNTNIFSNRSSGSSDIQSISTRGDFIAFVDEDGRLEVVDVTDAGLSTSADGRFSKEIHDTVAACVCFHPELLLLATGGFDSQVRIWDIASEKIIRQAAVGMVDSAQMSDSTPDASSANRVRMVNPPFIYALAFAPGLASSDGEAADVEHEAWTAVSGHADGRIMHTSAENSVYWPDCHNYSISAIRFMRSNPEILATAGLDKVIKLWNSDKIISPDNIGEGGESSGAVVKSTPPVLAHVDLIAKPDTLATAEYSPIIYTDENSSVVAFAVI